MPGTKPSLIARQQIAASSALAIERPCPVSPFVLETAGVVPAPKTLLIARSSDLSPMGVEVACALR
ncbi:hypothetical protein D3C83_239480 [compost metagenome]